MPDSAVSTTLCDQEPIHVPESIQPYGLLLVAALETMAVSHVSGDVEGVLGLTEWHGLKLATLLGAEMAEAAAQIGIGAGRVRRPDHRGGGAKARCRRPSQRGLAAGRASTG